MDDKYFYPVPGGKWVSRRPVNGEWIDLYQDNPLDDEQDAVKVLSALGIPSTQANLEYHFPRNKRGKRCPTLDLMELTIVLDPTNPHVKKKREVGV